MTEPEKPDESRTGANIAGAVAVIALVAGGVWLVNELHEAIQYEKCAAARRRNCDKIDLRDDRRPARPPE